MNHADEIAAVIATTKLCKDCRFHDAEAFGMTWQYAKCKTPKNGRNTVNGGGIVKYCEEARRDKTGCGIDAKWFEPIQTRQEARAAERDETNDYDYAVGKEGRHE